MKILGIEHIGIALKSKKDKYFWDILLGGVDKTTDIVKDQGVKTEIYDINSRLGQNVVYPFSTVINGNPTDFEICNVDFSVFLCSEGLLKERLFFAR